MNDFTADRDSILERSGNYFADNEKYITENLISGIIHSSEPPAIGQVVTEGERHTRAYESGVDTYGLGGRCG
jgi:hypothetical protein